MKYATPIGCIAALLGFFTLSACNDKPAAEAQSQRTTMRDSSATKAHGLRVAFIYGDTLNVKYQFLIDAEKELDSEGKLIDDRLRRKYERAEKRAAELQKEAPRMGQLEMQEAQIEMQNMQVEIQEFQEKLSRDYRQREVELQREYLKRVNDFLKEFNNDDTYDIILNFQPGGNLLWVSDSFDITDQVLKELNARYADEVIEADKKTKKK